MILSEARELTQERLKELLDYDPLTGIFRRKVRTSHCRIGDIAGSLMQIGYWVIWVDGVRQLAHRLAWLFVHGTWPKEIDHKNLERADNRIENLREASHSQNGANCRPRSGRKFKGVYFMPDGRMKSWQAKLTKDGKGYFLGSFLTEAEAHQAYIEAARRMHGEYALAS